MELYQLQVFVIVAEEENITRAARRLFATPSSISLHIKSLEDELNIQLFTRTSRGVQLTERGRLLYEKAQDTLRAVQDLANYATEIQSSLMGQVIIGLNTHPAFLRVSDWVSDLRGACTGIELQLLNSSSGRIMQQIKGGAMDMGFVYGDIDDPQLTGYRLMNVELVIACPPTWKEKIISGDWENLASLPWIGSDVYCPFQAITDTIFSHHQLRYQTAVQTDDDATRIKLVCAGVGLSLLEAHNARIEAEKGTLYIWETPDPIFCNLSLVCATHRQHEPLIRAVRESILKFWAK